MGRALALREDYDAVGLRGLARTTRHAGQARRLLALAAICDGASRGDAARLAGTDRQIVRDWVMRFNAEGPDGVRDHHGGGVVPRLTSEMLSALKTRLEDGPVPAVHGVVRWRLCDLCAWLHEAWGVSLSETRLGQIIRREGFRLLTARPRHYRQDTEAQDIFKKKFPGVMAAIGSGHSGKDIEIWWADEARIGQKTKLTRRWAKRGTRPRAFADLRTRSAWIFGAICPEKGTAAGLVLPVCNLHGMQLHLTEISRTVASGAHALLIVDQAAWHTSQKLDVPGNITILPLPPRAPELNPVENLWQFLRNTWLSNRSFRTYDDIVDIACHAWNQIVEQPWRIMSIGLRNWAHRF
ncbi:IS630 family transposase [Acetobacter sp. AN02]|uniref:IS630 family transposase n=1 Tax=Acetobacter sp. AN02 TaxID=2894186 RepID=UPI0024345D29|nr:IS630 family transposase [Acetobacter sp. AN02]MDG6094359.1 IS630 family transposase [Acetobacter sp. AN02]